MIPQQAAAKLARAARWWRDCDGAPVKVAREQVRTSAASARFDDSSLGKLVCRRLLEWPRLLHTATQIFISVCVPSGRSASGWPGTRTFAGSCCHALAGCTGRASGGNGSRHRAPPCPADGQSHLSIITVAPIILPVVLRKLVVRPALLPLWLRHPVDQEEGRERGRGGGTEVSRTEESRKNPRSLVPVGVRSSPLERSMLSFKTDVVSHRGL